MTKTEDILIVGAGPVGLSAALFLAHHGLKPRIIEARRGRSVHSKALAVNPRTLELFERTGATKAFLKNGETMDKMVMWRKGKRWLENDLSKAPGKYPFMLVQAQSETEEILEKLLNKKKIKVERRKAVEDITVTKDGVTVKIKGQKTPIKTKTYLAADGAHSTTRHLLNLSFDGHIIEDQWTLVDVELDLPLPDHEGHIWLGNERAIGLIRVKGKVWRIIGNRRNLIDYLPPGTTVGKVVWRSEFSISHRMLENFQHGPITFVGDAAHIHSPVGGRGMNLGIEDAYVFAELYAAGNLDRYDQVRHPQVTAVIKRIGQVTDLIQGHSIKSKLWRRLFPLAPFLRPLVSRRLMRFAMGLDHKVKL
jgi:2-polyprenyl-6-methoxyphenol hydroxylase-like FAD-dependent oxidoreductase